MNKIILVVTVVFMAFCLGASAQSDSSVVNCGPVGPSGSQLCEKLVVPESDHCGPIGPSGLRLCEKVTPSTVEEITCEHGLVVTTTTFFENGISVAVASSVSTENKCDE